MPQRVMINGVEFARRSEFVAGELLEGDLGRLRDSIIDHRGKVSYTLAGSVGSRGEALLHLRVEGLLHMRCQRCMEGLDHALDIDVWFELLTRDAELTQEEIEDDSRDFLPVDGDIDVPALVEDEIILALPVAPSHEDCSFPSGREKSDAESPFKVLAALKQQIH